MSTSTSTSTEALTVDHGSQVDFEVTLPAGRYRVGDPCYSVPDDRWHEWLEAAEYRQESYLQASLDGFLVVGMPTQYGDGEYFDQGGKGYGVDSGLIGMVPCDLPGLRQDYGTDEEAAANNIYHVVEFPRPVSVTCDSEGVLTFGHLVIDTDPDDDEDEGYVEDDEWGMDNWGDDDDEEEN